MSLRSRNIQSGDETRVGTPPRPWGVRVAAAVLTLGGIVIAGFFMRSPAERREIAQIERLGGRVFYHRIVDPLVERYTPDNLQHLIGGEVNEIWFFGPRPTDADLRGPLTQFRQLNRVDLPNTAITDASLKLLSTQRSLSIVRLEGTSVSDRGIEFLSTSKSISLLLLDNTTITDASAPHLAKMTQMSSLSLAGTAITDRAMDDLLKLPRLRLLDVSGTKISSSGLEKLKTHGTFKLCAGLSSL